MPLARIGVLLAATVSLLVAQSTGRLTGIVKDPSGGTVPEALVSVYRPGGTEPVYQSRTTGAGLFSFEAINPEVYMVVIEKEGFARYSAENVKVAPGEDLPLNGIVLTVGAQTVAVDAADKLQGVQTANAEVSTTITTDQIRRLPQLARDPLTLAQTQAGVSNNNVSNTVINGLRTTTGNATYEGIGVQDSTVRLQALDYFPNRLRLDQVSQFTLITSNPSSIYGNGASQIAFVAPSGGSELHGDVFYLISPNRASADTWSHQGSNYRHNQGGFTLGGPLKKNRLFLYGTYEFFRTALERSFSVLVPTAQLRTGIYSINGQQFDLLQVLSASADPTVKGILSRLPLPNIAGDVNVGTYQYGQTAHSDFDNGTLRSDYVMSSRHTISATYALNRDHGDAGNTPFGKATPAFYGYRGNLGVVTLRSALTPRLTNEARFGFDLISFGTHTRDALPYILSDIAGALPWPSAINSENRRQRAVDIQDNASYLAGRHKIQFGFQSQILRVPSRFNSPVEYSLGANVPPEFASIGFLIQDGAILAGRIHFASQPSYVPIGGTAAMAGVPEYHKWAYDNYAGYVQDNWSVRPGLTVTLGLRYEFIRPLSDANGLLIQAGSLFSPSATLDLAKGGFYRASHKDFAPNIGVAWDPFGKGRTAVRFAYGLSYVNDDLVTAVFNNLNTNARGALSRARVENSTESLATLPFGTLSSLNIPPVALAAFPAVVSSLFSGQTIGAVDRSLRTPYVQEWNAGIQHQLGPFVLDVKYVGNHAVGLLRGVNLNQGSIVNKNAVYPNSSATGGAYLLGNFSSSNYNSLQVDASRRFRRHLQAQVNYTFSKVLTDTPRLAQNVDFAYRDANNPRLDRSRAPFDQTHAFKANFVYDLPFGQGRPFHVPLARILGGWSISGILIAQSGNPFSIVSDVQTLPGASQQTANTTLSGSALDQVVQFQKTGTGPSMIASSAIGPTGTAFGGSQQAFSDPVTGPGTLQSRRFNGPTAFDLDFGVQKLFPLRERVRAEFRFEGINILNHPSFFPTDQNIDFTNFGRSFNTISSTVLGVAGAGYFQPRRLQFSAYIRF